MTEQLEQFKSLVRQYVALKKSLKKKRKPDLFTNEAKTAEDANELLWEITRFPCTELDVLHTKIGVFSHGTELRWLICENEEAAMEFLFSLNRYRGEHRSQTEIDGVARWLQLA